MERRLGKGLGSLLGASPKEEPSAPTDAIEISRINPNPFQPRRDFDPKGLDELCASIRNHGILQPVVVRRSGDRFELIAGERRFRASQQAGLKVIPAVVRDEVDDRDMLELALVENVQRQSLNAIEKALAYREMMAALKLTQEQVADKVGLRRSSVANHIRLLSLPEEAQDALTHGLISMGHARALVGLEHDAILKLVGQVSREGMSVRQVEGRVRALAGGGGEASSSSEEPNVKDIVPRAPWVGDIETRMRQHLGTKVQIKNGEGYRGQVVIEYYNRGDLDRLIDHLAPSEAI